MGRSILVLPLSWEVLDGPELDVSDTSVVSSPQALPGSFKKEGEK